MSRVNDTALGPHRSAANFTKQRDTLNVRIAARQDIPGNKMQHAQSKQGENPTASNALPAPKMRLAWLREARQTRSARILRGDKLDTGVRRIEAPIGDSNHLPKPPRITPFRCK